MTLFQSKHYDIRHADNKLIWELWC